MNKYLIALGGIVLGLAVGLYLLPYVQESRGGVGASIDKHFIEEMIPHHEGAISMAELALERSSRPELKSLAENIIEAQASENEQMRAWYKDWFNTSIPQDADGMMSGMMHGSVGRMSGMEGDLESLRRAENFDLEFIEQMIPHHEMAIMMARMLSTGTNRSEMKNLAENIIESQSREIELMRGWYEEWSK